MNSRRPVIGVTISDYKSRIAWFFDRLAVWRAGGRPVRLSPARRADPRSLDGLVIGGGDDIEAHLYEGEISFDVRVDPARDRLELKLLESALLERKPVLGICRGAQMINVSQGGTLHEDIHAAYPAARRMRTVLPRMTVEIEPESRLYEIVGIARCRVNSLHHQSVDRLGKGLRAVAHEKTGHRAGRRGGRPAFSARRAMAPGIPCIQQAPTATVPGAGRRMPGRAAAVIRRQPPLAQRDVC